ncbi:putative D-3-phosphoglycerate dehydrogenase [Klebsiella pneumoniae]|nr:putative D-3-phosphoglycerate dehydrogenase [Klebsiella pneumoniae]
MKIVFTAEHAGDLSAFHQLGELLVEGWALGKPKLSAGQLIGAGPRRRGAGGPAMMR